MIKFLKQIMSGKANYHHRNIVYVGEKIPKPHSQEFIGTVKIREFTNVRAAVLNFFHPKQSLILELAGQVFLRH